MKKTVWLILFILLSVSGAFSQTNDFYDDSETFELGIPDIEISGEIKNPGKADFSMLTKHSVIVKEARTYNGKVDFVGAYRYDGYSLRDILNKCVLKKNNAEAFPPVIDMYIEVENTRGEKTVISWGEIYYPSHLDEIIIATRVTRIVPTKTKNQWPLPTAPRLVIASDLLTERNLDSPAKIRLKSYARPYTINKGMRPMYAPALTVFQGDKSVAELKTIPKGMSSYLFHSIFYGRGTGIHKTTPFRGALLKELLSQYVEQSPENYKSGFLVIGGKDGYHGVYSFSEVFNRNDQAEVLIYIEEKDEDGGKFKIFPAADFFSDRAIKAAETIFFEVVR